MEEGRYERFLKQGKGAGKRRNMADTKRYVEENEVL